MARTLHLVLKGQYYDMIDSDFKPEEYRGITNFWFKRLFGKYICDAETGLK